MENKKTLLKSWGENTAYSAKCHFKMSDFNRYFIYSLVVINLVFAVFSLLELGEILVKVFSILSLIASILILVHESQRSANSMLSHKEVGELYLALHYDIETIFHLDIDNISDGEIIKLKEQVKELNQKPKPSVNFIAKSWAKNSIEKTEEMHNWWKNV